MVMFDYDDIFLSGFHQSQLFVFYVLILILNLMLLLILGLVILNVQKEKFFPKTRELLFRHENKY